MTDLRRLFEQEMRALLEEGEAFAKDFPEAARYLESTKLEDRDPYVERLVEGVAFLTAQARELADDVSTLFAHDLFEQLAPELLMPLSSVSVVRFAPQGRDMGVVQIPAGAMVRSVPVERSPEGVPFRLLHPITVTSARVRNARLVEHERDGSAHLEWEFVSTSIRDFLWPDPLRLFLFGDAPMVWSLRYALSRRATLVEIWANGKWAESNLSFSIPELPCYTTETDLASPLTKARDFLCSDERFRFVDLQGLRGCSHPAKHPLRLRVRLQGPLPRGMARGVATSTFRLNAGVVVNRSFESLQGQTWGHTQTEIPIRPLGAGHREVLEVRSVRGFDAAPPHRKTSYRKYSTHAWGAGQGVFHVANRRNTKGRMQTVLGLGYPDLNQKLTCQNLAIEGVCGDGDHPFQYVAADKIAVSGNGVPDRIAVKGLVRQSPCHRSPEGPAVQSIVFALMQGHNQGWLDPNRLKDGLRHVLWDLTESKRTLIESIQSVSSRILFETIKGVVWRVNHVEIGLRDTTCTPDTWDRIGVLQAFSDVLHGFATDQTEIGFKCRLTVCVEPCGVAFQYGEPT